jgi:putative membrane protein
LDAEDRASRSSSDQRRAIRGFVICATIDPMRLIFLLVVNAAALAIATWILSGITLTGSSSISKIITLFVVALIFGVLNTIIKPLFALITAPLILLTLGLFLIVINACMLLLTSWLAGFFNLGWNVDDFWTAVLGAIIISIVSFILNFVLRDRAGQSPG